MADPLRSFAVEMIQKTLRADQLTEIAARFEALNPYDRKAVPGSILDIEDVNRDSDTGQQRPIHALAISAKRYALFMIGDDGRPVILETKEHGLGPYLDPTDPEREDRDWIRQTCQATERDASASPSQPRPHRRAASEEPAR